MLKVSISIDVPNLEEGFKFYNNSFGFIKISDPIKGVMVLKAENIEICLLEKKEGSIPAIDSTNSRTYKRHWSPIHLDFHVDNLDLSLKKVIEAGAIQEQIFKHESYPSVAFCCDPFGHGFCIIEKKKK